MLLEISNESKTAIHNPFHFVHCHVSTTPTARHLPMPSTAFALRRAKRWAAEGVRHGREAFGASRRLPPPQFTPASPLHFLTAKPDNHPN